MFEGHVLFSYLCICCFFLHIGCLVALILSLDGSRLPFLLLDFVEGRCFSQELDYDEFKLPLIDDSLN